MLAAIEIMGLLGIAGSHTISYLAHHHAGLAAVIECFFVGLAVWWPLHARSNIKR